MRASLDKELKRLRALQKVNPNIREEEITFLSKQISESDYFINHAELHVQALRVVVNSV